MGWYTEFAPFSWVASGAFGLLLYVLCFYIYATAKQKVVRSRYDLRALHSGATAHPMEKIFERKRIFLSEFTLPSSPFIHDKTFIDCEFVGPSNIFLSGGNNIVESLLPNCDAAVLPEGRQIFNSVCFTDCTFKRCSFQRTTFFVSAQEYEGAKSLHWLNWVSYGPEGKLLGAEKPALLEEKTNAKPETSPEGQD